jgi:hypothetical protein
MSPQNKYGCLQIAVTSRVPIHAKHLRRKLTVSKLQKESTYKLYQPATRSLFFANLQQTSTLATHHHAILSHFPQ